MLGIINCPHCDTRVVPMNDVCPACRRNVKDKHNAASNLEAARLQALVSDLVSAGKSKAVIVRFLAEELGVPPAKIEVALAHAQPFYRSAGVVRGARDLIIGLVCLVGGAAVTFVTFQLASLRGGYVFIAYGPVVFGGYRFVLGMRRFLYSRRRVTLVEDHEE